MFAATVAPLCTSSDWNFPLGRLEEASVELRLLPSLVALGERLVATSLHYSLIRMRNAAGWRHEPGSPVGAAR